MNKAEFIKKVNERVNSELGSDEKITLKLTEHVIEASLGLVEGSLQEGEEVNLTGFGKFERKLSKERNGVNPQTKDPILIEARYYPKFTAFKNFKETVKEG